MRCEDTRRIYQDPLPLYIQSREPQNPVLQNIASEQASPVAHDAADMYLHMDKAMLTRCIYVVLLFYVHSKHLRSCRDGQLT